MLVLSTVRVPMSHCHHSALPGRLSREHRGWLDPTAPDGRCPSPRLTCALACTGSTLSGTQTEGDVF